MPSSAPRILVVEDDLCMRTVVQKLLLRVSPDASITWVTSAEQVDCRESYELVICDHRLPGKITGLALWGEFQRRAPQTPFVLMSGIPLGEFLEMLRHSNATPSFLSKPFRGMELACLARSLLRRGGGRRRAA